LSVNISILIPFLNESENIQNLTQQLGAYCQSRSEVFEIIFIDDGSTDNSAQLLQQTQHIGYEARLIKLSKNYGSHAALRAGIQHASGDVVTFLYADLQDPVHLVHEMFEKINSGKEIVWANRKRTNQGFIEKLFSRIYASLMRRFAFPDFPKKGFDIVMFTQKVRKVLNNHIEGNSSIFLQILSMGFPQDFIEYDKVDRKAGKSKWTFSKRMKLFIDSFVAFSYFPIRLVSVVGIAFFLLGLFWTIYIITRHFVVGDLTPGWPGLVSILMLGFGITNIALGIIAEYLWRNFDAARGRPVFIVDGIKKLN